MSINAIPKLPSTTEGVKANTGAANNKQDVSLFSNNGTKESKDTSSKKDENSTIGELIQQLMQIISQQTNQSDQNSKMSQ